MGLVRRVARAVLREHDCPHGVNVIFTGDARIRRLNRRYRGRARVTDVLAFPIREPGDSDEVPLGEIYVNVERAVRVAPENGTTPRTEALLYVVHGLLHLLGFDDGDAAERRRMWAEQKRLMADLGHPLP